MDDPGILVWDGVAGDWMFQSEEREWRDLLVGEVKKQQGKKNKKLEREEGASEKEEGGKDEPDRYRKGEQSGKVFGQDVVRKESWVKTAIEERELRSLKILSTTALTRNKVQFFPTTRRPELRDLVSEDQVSSKAVEQCFASTALQLGTSLTSVEKERGQSGYY